MPLRSKFFCLAFATLTFIVAPFVAAQNLDADGKLPRATPESVGVSSEALLGALQEFDAKIERIDGFTILRDGKVVAEGVRSPNSFDDPHALYSLSKSFASTAIGFAVAEGLLSLDSKIVDFLPEDLPEEPDPRLKDVTIEHLLTMTCGHAEDFDPPGLVVDDYGLEPRAPVSPTWSQDFLARKIVHEPGTKFVYNTGGMYIAGRMLQKVTGQTLNEYLVPRLYEPLHIETPFWEASAEGASKGGTGLFLALEDVAKFGQFYLQKGRWNGERLLSQEWVERATSNHLSNDPNGGYGYQFWRHGRWDYYGMGSLGQFCIVLPEQRMVVALLSDVKDLARYLGILHNEFLPALKAAVSDAPLEENADALAKLRDFEKTLPIKEGSSGSKVFDETIASKALGREMKYRVYVPNEYQSTSFSYPTLYLLCGLGGNEQDWSNKKGKMQEICDRYFAERPTEKRIVVMPDGASSWYRDSKDDSCKFETFFFDELIPEVQRKYRCKTERETRAIAGLSMGGYGSLLYALRRPEMFESCYAMSAAIRTKEEVATHAFKEFLKRYKSREDMKETDERFDDYYFANDPHSLVLNMPEDQKGAVRFFLDCGDDDKLLAGNFALFKETKKSGVPCELRVRDGGHEWKYWREALPMALEFIAKKAD